MITRSIFSQVLMALRTTSGMALLVACLASDRPAAAQGAGQGTITLEAVPAGSGAVQQATARRRAIFLIDCSSSMTLGILNKDSTDSTPKGTPANPVRWDAMMSHLAASLESLAKASPGIEVDLRFFGAKLDCFGDEHGDGSVHQVLSDPASAKALLQGERFARREIYAKESGTALHSSIKAVLAELTSNSASSQFDWTYFVIISDGRDSLGDKKSDWAEVFAKFRADPRNAAAVGAVGPEANAMISAGDFGDLGAADISKLLPKPPPPRRKYRVSLAPPDQRLGGAQAVAGPSDYPVWCPVVMAASGNAQDLAHLRLTARTESGSSLGVSEMRPPAATGGPWALTVRLPATASAGIASSLQLVASSAPGAPCEFVGDVRVEFAFPATKSLPPEQWTFEFPTAIRRSEKATFAANVGQVKSAHWRFDPPGGGASKEEPGAIVSRQFDATGSWGLSVRTESQEGRPQGPQRPTRPAAAVTVVDSDFDMKLAGPAVSRRDATVVVTRKPGADSAASVEFMLGSKRLDGAPSKLGPKETKVTIPGAELGAGLVNLRAVVRSDVGGFEWSHDLRFEVADRPWLGVRAPPAAVEGSESIEVEVLTGGDVGASVSLSLDGAPLADVPVAQGDKGPRPPITVKVPTRGFRSSEANLTVTAAGNPAPCEPASATLSLRPAELDIGVDALGAGKDGATLEGDGKETVAFRLAGRDAAAFKDARMAIEIDDPAKPVRLSASRDQDGRWKATAPSGLRPGRHAIRVTVEGGGLRTDLFPRQPREFSFDIRMPSIRIVQIPVDPAGMTVRPGKPLTLGLDGVPTATLDLGAISWAASFNGSQVSVPPGATMSWMPAGWGSLDVAVTAPMVDGTKLHAKATIPVQGSSPVVQPKLDDATPQQGSESLGLTPGVSGDFRSFVVELWECDRSGNRIGDAPAWRSQDFEADPGSVDVPISRDAVGRGIEHFEVQVAVSPYPGDPRPAPAPVVLGGRVVPAPLVHWWILCVLLMGFIAWWLWGLLSGNEPLRWELEFSSRDPGPPTESGDSAMSRVIIRDRRKHPDGKAPGYRGWSRREKHAYIPLWLLKDRSDESELEWLGDDQYLKLQLRVRSFWSNPVDQVPGPDLGWAEVEQRYESLDGDLRLSCTKKLVEPNGPGGESRCIFLRMRCNPGKDPLFWIFWTWCGASAVAAVLLLQVFHIVNY